MQKKNKNSGKRKMTYLRRAPMIGMLMLALFLAEIFGLIHNSSISAAGNEKVASYKAQTEKIMNIKNITMGDIFDANGTALVTYDEPGTKGTYLDPYVYSSVLGYANSQTVVGLIGKYQNLLRTTAYEEDTKGYGLKLTLDHDLSEAVYEALTETIGADGRGSMVVMDAETGEILSMVSTPVYNASNISEDMEWMNDPERNNGVWYPLAKCGVIAPGSTFKLISSIVMLENGLGNFTTEDETTYEGNGYTVSNYEGYRAADGKIGIAEALRKSSNVYFIKALIGFEGAQEKLTDKAKKISLGDDLVLDFGTVISSWTYDEDIWAQVLKKKLFNEERELATTIFGQSEIRMSCLQGAMLAAGIVNGGKIMTPYMIDSAISADGSEVDFEALLEKMVKAGTFNETELPVSGQNTVYSELTSSATADQLLDMMRYAGTKQYGFDSSLNVAAKSGTSETGSTGNSGNNAWMVSSAEFGGHKYAIAINWANAASGTQGKDMKVPVETIYNYLKNNMN